MVLCSLLFLFHPRYLRSIHIAEFKSNVLLLLVALYFSGGILHHIYSSVSLLMDASFPPTRYCLKGATMNIFVSDPCWICVIISLKFELKNGLPNHSTSGFSVSPDTTRMPCSYTSPQVSATHLL